MLYYFILNQNTYLILYILKKLKLILKNTTNKKCKTNKKLKPNKKTYKKEI